MKIKRVGFGGIPIQRITQEETNKVIDELDLDVEYENLKPEEVEHEEDIK